MGKTQAIEVGTTVFRTKAKLKNFTKSILWKYDIGELLSESDCLFLNELLKRHPEYEHKVGSGIDAIIIKVDGYWKKTRCFNIVRTDGSSTDFSYLHCIDNDTSRELLKMFKQSARRAVEEQVVKHLASYRNKTGDLRET